jgi:hypothetical protein
MTIRPVGLRPTLDRPARPVRPRRSRSLGADGPLMRPAPPVHDSPGMEIA